MAIEYVGGTSGAGTSTGYTVSLAGTLTGGIGTSPIEGDFVVAWSVFGNTASSAPDVSGNNTGAYTGAHAALNANDTWDTEARALYMVQGATPDTSLAVTRVTNAAYGGATTVQVWRGVDPDNPLDVAAVTATGTNGSRANPAAITPVTSGAVILAFGAGTQGTAGSAFAAPSGMTSRGSVNADGTTSDIGAWGASIDWTSGAYDPAAAAGGATSNSCSWAAATLALRPAPTITVEGRTLASDAVAGSTFGGGAVTPAAATAEGQAATAWQAVGLSGATFQAPATSAAAWQAVPVHATAASAAGAAAVGFAAVAVQPRSLSAVGAAATAWQAVDGSVIVEQRTLAAPGMAAAVWQGAALAPAALTAAGVGASVAQAAALRPAAVAVAGVATAALQAASLTAQLAAMQGAAAAAWAAATVSPAALVASAAGTVTWQGQDASEPAGTIEARTFQSPAAGAAAWATGAVQPGAVLVSAQAQATWAGFAVPGLAHGALASGRPAAAGAMRPAATQAARPIHAAPARAAAAATPRRAVGHSPRP